MTDHDETTAEPDEQTTPQEPAEDTPTTEAEDTPDEAPDEPEAPEESDEGEDDDKPGREAAKYRRRLREAEAERDALADKLEAAQRHIIDRMLTGPRGLRSTEAFWLVHKVSDLLGEDGTVDADKVKAAQEDAVERLGIGRRSGGNHVPREGQRTNAPLFKAEKPTMAKWLAESGQHG